MLERFYSKLTATLKKTTLCKIFNHVKALVMKKSDFDSVTPHDLSLHSDYKGMGRHSTQINLVALALTALLVGCASVPGNDRSDNHITTPFSATKEEIANGDFSKVAFCRPSSIMKATIIPDVRVNGVQVFELSSGSHFELVLKPERQVDLHLGKNLFAQRFKEQTLTSFKAEKGKEKYILVFGLGPSLADSISSVIASGNQGYIDLPSGAGWRISVVSREEYEERCKPK